MDSHKKTSTTIRDLEQESIDALHKTAEAVREAKANGDLAPEFADALLTMNKVLDNLVSHVAMLQRDWGKGR
jgi:hypothetical protein